MSLALRWRIPDRQVPTRWRGPQGQLAALSRDAALPIAGIVGPPGPAGPSGAAPLRLDAALSATWILPHPLDRVPTVQVYLASGEAVLSDVSATASQITVTFPSPQQGFVLAF
jgi:hypothetical protein